MVIKILFIIFLIIMLTSACYSDVNKFNFSNYSEMSNDNSLGWLPDYFPESAINIEFSSNLDMNYYNAYFSLLPSDEAKFISGLDKSMNVLNANTLNQYIKSYKEIKEKEKIWCIFSENTKWDQINNWSIVIKLRKGDYFITSITLEEYKRYCD